jgi:hypothetical protein
MISQAVRLAVTLASPTLIAIAEVVVAILILSVARGPMFALDPPAV